MPLISAFPQTPSALGDFYDRHAGRAHAVALAVCLDPGRATRAVREAFLVLAADSFAFPETPGTLPQLLLSTHRHAVDEARWSGQAYRPFPGLATGPAEMLALARFGRLDCTGIAGVLAVSPADVKRGLRDGLRALGDAAAA